ncbi:MAG: hypothetical protein Q8P97_01875 [bacterium]|nr:hypothetical protein [bacterium]
MKYNFLLTWLPIAVVITLLCGLIYITVQQVIRIGANDPQIAIAEDVANALQGGVDPQTIVGGQTSDILKSLDPFVIIFDEGGNPLASSVQLDGKTPTPPRGVFDSAKSHGDDRLTWQPKPSVRIAAVVAYYSSGNSTSTKPGFVLAGRSLREIEKRVDSLGLQVLVGWLVILIISFLGFFVLENFRGYLPKFFD